MQSKLQKIIARPMLKFHSEINLGLKEKTGSSRDSILRITGRNYTKKPNETIRYVWGVINVVIIKSAD
jgi:hypothetical protein